MDGIEHLMASAPKPVTIKGQPPVDPDTVGPLIKGNSAKGSEVAAFLAKADPKAKGFNYNVGWQGEFPPVYYEANVVADVMREAMSKASRRSWDMDMALRAMRHSDTQEEFDRAILRVKAEMAKVGQSFLHPANDNAKRPSPGDDDQICLSCFRNVTKDGDCKTCANAD